VNIVFDLGGVVVAYDRRALIAELYPDSARQALVEPSIFSIGSAPRATSSFCLSNMHPESIAFLEEEFSFGEVFAGSVISCRVGLCKPEPEIYEHLLRRYALIAAETILVDDLEKNLTAARACGIHTIRFEDPTQCARALRALGVNGA